MNRAWRNSVGKCKQAKLCIYPMNLTPEKPENEEEMERAGDGVVRWRRLLNLTQTHTMEDADAGYDTLPAYVMDNLVELGAGTLAGELSGTLLGLNRLVALMLLQVWRIDEEELSGL